MDKDASAAGLQVHHVLVNQQLLLYVRHTAEQPTTLDSNPPFVTH
jgi:hypothetical protein